MNFKPMLSADASDVDLSTLQYPLYLSPKLDGVRCLIWEGVAYSRNAKPIRNKFVQEWAENMRHHNLDGELIVGSPTDPLCLNATQSGVMSISGQPDFRFHYFDAPAHPGDFLDRLSHVQRRPSVLNDPKCVEVIHILVYCEDDVRFWEQKYLELGYEGVMLRAPGGPYKHGRSTLREGYLMKLKQFQDGEALVIGLEEGHVNSNELQRDELGRAKRTTHQENLVPSGMVGTLICEHPTWGTLRVAPGTMPHSARKHFWENPARIVGTTIHWRSFGYGVKDKPRFPRYYGIREDA